MNLLVLTYKVGWRVNGEYVTYAGFPYQMESLARLFHAARIMLLIRNEPAPQGCVPLGGENVSIFALPEPRGSDLRRKLSLLFWLPRYLPRMWREISQADVIHVPVPGDVGFIGLLLALIQRKRLFIRHCGTWGEPITLADKILLWLLEKIADERRVIVFATGGAEAPPSRKNPHIRWIFATTLTQREIDETPRAPTWDGKSALRLVTVGRLSENKNIQSILRALPALQKTLPNLHLDILGEGVYRSALELETHNLQLSSAVTFHGNVSHERVLQILSQSHLFVFPTRVKEGFPKALLEALACGLPSIATRVSVIPQLLQNGSGIALDETTPQAVADAVLKMTSNPEEMNQRRSLARRAAQGYTLEAWGQTIGDRLRAAWGNLT